MGRRPGAARVFRDAEHGDIYRYAFTAKGKRYRGSTGCRDYERAQAEADRLYAKALQGQPPQPNQRRGDQAAKSLDHMFAEFIASRIGKKASSYVDKFKSHYRAHFAHRWVTLEEIIVPGAIDAYASDRLAGKAPAVEVDQRRPRPEKGSTSTVAKELVTLRLFLKWCKARGLIDSVPDFDPVKVVSDYKPPDYTEADVRRLLAAIPDRTSHRRRMPAREFFTVQWAQAFRPGELESLRRCDVNLERREVTVRQSEDKARAGRTIHLADEAFAVLKKLLAPDGPPTALIFGKRKFNRSLELAAEACGLPRPTPHNLRHFRLTELGHAPTTAPASLQFFAGHKHLATTDRYLRSRTKATRDMLTALSKPKGRRF